MDTSLIFKNILKSNNCSSINSEKTIILDKPITVVSNTNKNDYIHFYPCNTAITKYNEDYIVNIRYVNYWIKFLPDNSVEYFGNYKNHQKVFISANKYIKLNSFFEILESKFMEVDFNEIETKIKERHQNASLHDKDVVVGVEDVRLYKYGKTMVKYIGSKKYSSDKMFVVSGEYNYTDLDNFSYIDKKYISNVNDSKPQYSTCEKNWVFVELDGELNVVYKWYPLQICYLDYDSNCVTLKKEIKMPIFFQRMRGSTCGSIFEDQIWFITHFVDWEIHPKRKYYHVFVIFDLKMKLLNYSQPFTFENSPIEFCTGLIVDKDNFLMTYSIFDNCSKLSVYNKKTTVDSLKWKRNL